MEEEDEEMEVGVEREEAGSVVLNEGGGVGGIIDWSGDEERDSLVQKRSIQIFGVWGVEECWLWLMMN